MKKKFFLNSALVVENGAKREGVVVAMMNVA